MFRTHLTPEPDFRWRGGEISRLEAFSDAVFAFAVTLLVVSLEVPHTYHELMETMRGFPAFALCFAMLAHLWYLHARYFRRYGLQDAYSVFLNSVLLFVVLFYVYPLKFLFTLMAAWVTRGATLPEGARGAIMLKDVDAPSLMIVYGVGYAAVFLVFALMYLNAYRKRDALELDPCETLRTKQGLCDSIAMVGMGLLSVTIALVVAPSQAGIAGFAYFLIGLYFTISGHIFGKKLRRLKEGPPK